MSRPHPANESSGLRVVLALPVLLLRCALLAWVILRFSMRGGTAHLGTLRRAFALSAQLRAERVRSPLSAHGGQVYELERAWLEQCVCAAKARGRSLPAALQQVVALHFTATGETRHGPVASLERALAHTPELAQLRHFVIDAPHTREAYAGPMAFADALWSQVAPLVDAHRGPFLFFGLSRGALAALELGLRVARDKGKVSIVVAYSPPLVRPSRLSPAIELIGSLQPLVEDAASLLDALGSAWLRAGYARVSRPVQTLLTSLVLAELRIADPVNLRWALRDLAEDDPLQTSLRSVREFAMLTRVQNAELTALANDFGTAAAGQASFSALVVWGERDAWTPAAQNLALLAGAIARAAVPAADFELGVLPGSGHALCREHDASTADLGQLLARALVAAERKLLAGATPGSSRPAAAPAPDR